MKDTKESKILYVVDTQPYLYWSGVMLVVFGGIIMFSVNVLLGTLVANLWWFVYVYQQRAPADIKMYARRISNTGTYGTVVVRKKQRLLSATQDTYVLLDKMLEQVD